MRILFGGSTAGPMVADATEIIWRGGRPQGQGRRAANAEVDAHRLSHMPKQYRSSICLATVPEREKAVKPYFITVAAALAVLWGLIWLMG
jgi:hypothetical protein